MKRFLLPLILSLLSGIQPVRAQIEVKAAPSETVELMNVMMSYTGENAFANPPHVLPEYKTFVDGWFAKHRDHSAIRYIATEIMEKGLMNRLETPATIGINSRIEQGAFVYTGDGEGWSDEVKKSFVHEVNKFYRDTDFGAFWQEAQNKYEPADIAFNEIIIPKMNGKWLSGFIPVEGARSYDITISYLCGGYNFGATKNGVPNPVVGIPYMEGRPPVWEDPMGVYMVSTAILHECLHPFCDPLTVKYYPGLEGPGEVIFPKIREQAGQAFYGSWRAVLSEALIRASVIASMRMDDSFAPYIGQHIGMDKNTGIFWVEELADLLSEYEANRDRYPTLDSFMPEVVRFYRKLTAEGA